MKNNHLLSITDLNPEELNRLVDRAIELKGPSISTSLAGCSVALLFEKPSLRTKTSFDVGIHQMGGHPIYLGPQEVGLGVREPIADVARVLDRYVDCVVARVNNHSSLVELARYSKVPVINALSNWEHPCQILSDLQTIKEAKGQLKGVKVAYVGDGNNTARSLALGIASVGGNFAIASPKGYELDSQTLDLARSLRSHYGTTVDNSNDVLQAVSGADVVYTDVWISMGEEAERAERLKAFKNYTVDHKLMSHAESDAIFMHDMPAHYGEELAYGMLDHPKSVVFDQAENRLHSQKALLEYLVESKQRYG